MRKRFFKSVVILSTWISTPICNLTIVTRDKLTILSFTHTCSKSYLGKHALLLLSWKSKSESFFVIIISIKQFVSDCIFWHSLENRVFDSSCFTRKSIQFLLKVSWQHSPHLYIILSLTTCENHVDHDHILMTTIVDHYYPI